MRPSSTSPSPSTGSRENAGLGPFLQTKLPTLVFLALAELLAMGLWFSASAIVPELTVEWSLGTSQQSLLTLSVQLGFVLGALTSALLNLADRISSRILFAISALAAGCCTLAIPLLELGFTACICLRFCTGFFLAGVYPPGMKLVTTWTTRDRGFYIGILVAALTLGSALPHFLNSGILAAQSGFANWQAVLVTAALLSFLAAAIVFVLVGEGPHAQSKSKFNWKLASRAMTLRPLRLANFGYLGHMWELYAMWTWVPLCLLASYEAAEWSASEARLAAFAVIGIGALGSVLAGLLADRLGRTTITIASLAVSGLCCCVAGLAFGNPTVLTTVCLIWGFAVVADSAQFSAAVSELSEAEAVGTALTTQTCMGFVLTLVSIHLLAVLQPVLGWSYVFVLLAPGPLLGILAMRKLRSLPEAVRMASGKR